jgi:hypothetical protein
MVIFFAAGEKKELSILLALKNFEGIVVCNALGAFIRFLWK